MSNQINDTIIENLYEAMLDLKPHITISTYWDFERYIAENDIEGAKALVKILESKYADDL